jgi:hypothetical protein
MRRCSLRSRTSWLAVLLLAGGGVAFGQEGETPGGPRLTEPGEVFEDEIETDRDSFTPATTVVGRRRVAVESSYSFLDNREGAETHSFPELLTRVGITENVELRLGWNYEIGGGGSVSSTGSPTEEEPLAEGAEEEGSLLYGFKVSLTEQDCWLPQSALIVQANTPTAGPANATQFSAGYVLGWTLPNDWMFDSSLRYAAASEEGDHFNLWAPSIVLKVPVDEKWKAHLEYFGIFTQNRESERGSQYVSPGIHYLVTPDFEIGIRVGWGLTDDSARFFSNVGAGLRF